MSLSQKIAAAVEAGLPSSGDLSVEDGPHRLRLALTASGPVGLAFDALEFQTSARTGDWPIDALRAWGDRLAARLTYLMEPVTVLEADPIGGEVALRSQAPTARQGHRSYFEIRLGRRGTLQFGRVRFDEETRRRQPAPCQMTLEVLERLADDLAASVA
ncbi:MAG TPA: hypothetical protein VF590_25735 [Isosphaeraceae bacterium]|jgi:hypothetical protein